MDVELREEGNLEGPLPDHYKAGGDPFYSILTRALPGEFRYLIMIDPYGNTIFNRISMPLLIPELERLQPFARSDLEARTLDRVIALAKRCEADVHQYLKFVGD